LANPHGLATVATVETPKLFFPRFYSVEIGQPDGTGDTIVAEVLARDVELSLNPYQASE
jgi:hypothetical protein